MHVASPRLQRGGAALEMLNPQMNSRGAVTHRPRRARVAEPTISPDSLLEGDGFEPSVPVTNEPAMSRKANARMVERGSLERVVLLVGDRGLKSSLSATNNRQPARYAWVGSLSYIDTDGDEAPMFGY